MPGPIALPRPSGIQGLQFIRANAVLLVVLTHAAAILGFQQNFNAEFMGGLLAKGAVGVDMFFVLSGFIIIFIALREDTLEPRTSPGQFLLKRFLRIVPFLWFAVIAYAAIRFVGTGEFEWRPYFNSLFLIPVGEVRPNVVWSLRHEALFYLVFAIAFLLRKKAPSVLYLWCTAPVLVWGLSDVLDLPLPSGELFEFVFNRANALFGSGVLIGLAYQKKGFLRTPLRSTIAGWALVFLASLLAFAVRDSWGTPAVAIAASVCVVAGLLTPNSESLVARVWQLIGDASYAIYLIHNIGLLVGAAVWVDLLGKNSFGIAILSLSILVVIVGVLVHLFIEKPIIAYSKKAMDALGHRVVRTRAGVRTPEAW